ncbi:putative ring finger protein [Diplodia seriata]|uniref:Putative ring finger protein n=1 Tax=Diplodia seriata TaxID=420778 RepID=A0A0G2DVJ1_9PEZI|nr:putative ring finger protein [Diplodia seriata]
MRIAAYVGTSVALAASVLLRAAYERPNFYSACVYLSQSNACLMILTNLVLLFTASFMYGLQRLLYGPLRPMEVERLYEHAWFAITETLLAMTIFRDDVGVWFFVMFVSLIAGKIWQWIGAGRVEFVEQQPPTSNEIFFHSRLASSLILSIVYDSMMLGYCVDFVLRQARPNMIVMFGFEYALLLIESFATFFRHILCLIDLTVQNKQTEAKRQEMLEERRAERQRQREEAGEGVLTAVELAAEDIEVDDNEIDVPGWEGKGRWVFYLDLAKDFVKLTIYMAFFVILMTFHGLPIHIMRDVLLTFRSFHKRIYDFLRYRNATRDMNSRYPDATAEDLGENNICIICREEMRPWTTPEQAQVPAGGAPPAQTPQRPIDERHRAKKLPLVPPVASRCSLRRAGNVNKQTEPTWPRTLVHNPDFSKVLRMSSSKMGTPSNRLYHACVRFNLAPFALDMASAP